MGKLRRSGSRSWARGFFAIFSILLAAASGLYLFNLITNPDALGSQTAQVNSLAPNAAGQRAAMPAATASLPSGAAKSDPAMEKKLAELSAGVAALTRQVASIDTRLKPIEKFVGPVAALPAATSVTTSPPELPADLGDPTAPPPPEPQAEAAPEPAPPPEPAASAAPDPAPETDPTPDPAPVAEDPVPEPQPMEQAAAPADAAPEAAEEPAAAPADTPPAGEDPASAAEAPASPEAEQPAADAASAPNEAPIESAALDPVALPPTANDGTTRYGIELGVVAKQDGLRPLWREFLTNHAALVAGLQPRRVLAPDKKWRLIAGPFANAEEAAQACALFKKVSRPCEATVYAGDRL
jgi:hypothetical protein